MPRVKARGFMRKEGIITWKGEKNAVGADTPSYSWVSLIGHWFCLPVEESFLWSGCSLSCWLYKPLKNNGGLAQTVKVRPKDSRNKMSNAVPLEWLFRLHFKKTPLNANFHGGEGDVQIRPWIVERTLKGEFGDDHKCISRQKNSKRKCGEIKRPSSVTSVLNDYGCIACLMRNWKSVGKNICAPS